jgi:hypothetical protein
MPSIAFARPIGHQALMQFRCLRLLLALGLVGFSAAAEEKKKPAKGDRQAAEAHMREELGVNEFTTPGIEVILRALRNLRPIPFESVWRDQPDSTPPDRAQLALSTGAVIADGFLAVIAEKQSRVESAGRSLLKHAKGLGVADHITKHARSILERAATKDWQGVESALTGAQRDVEKGMLALRDEEIAHLIALGGWWRGLEITSTIVAESYSPERAALLIQPGMLDYFADRLSTLNPALKKKPLFAQLETNLREARKLIIKPDGKAPTAAEIKTLRDLAKATNQAARTVEE